MKQRRRGRTKRKRLLGRKKAARSPLWRAQMSRYPIAATALGGAKRQIGWRLLPPRLISASLLIVAGWLIYWFSSADLFYVRGVRVEGNWRLPEAELLAMSGLEGVNVFWADTQAATRAIAALPDVEAVQVRCGLPADCVIRLVEREALLVWRQGEAQIWIGADGTAVPARGHLPNAIVLDAAGSEALRPGERLDPVLVAAVQELERLQPSVRVYQYSDRYGLMFESAHGWPVRLGKGEEIASRLALVRALADYLSSQGIVPALVDVRYLEAPYYQVQGP
jgi:cell division septal protein FtsQ